jgi:hypothetical protein
LEPFWRMFPFFAPEVLPLCTPYRTPCRDASYLGSLLEAPGAHLSAVPIDLELFPAEIHQPLGENVGRSPPWSRSVVGTCSQAVRSSAGWGRKLFLPIQPRTSSLGNGTVFRCVLFTRHSYSCGERILPLQPSSPAAYRRSSATDQNSASVACRSLASRTLTSVGGNDPGRICYIDDLLDGGRVHG